MKNKFILYLCNLMFFSTVFSQEYGLKLASSETSKDLRTGVSLISNNNFIIDDITSLSFDLKLDETSKNTFGTIVRMLFGEEEFVDLNLSFSSVKYYKMALSSKNEYDARKKTDSSFAKGQWFKCSLAIDTNNNQIQFYTEFFNNKPIQIKLNNDLKNKPLKLFIGKHIYGKSRNTDVPSAGIRDFRISKNQKEFHHWKFNEYEGDKVFDQITKDSIQINNPIWLSKPYSKWEFIYEKTINGKTNVTFDDQKNTIYFNSNNGLIQYDLTNQKENITPHKTHVYSSIVAFTNSINQELHNYTLDQKNVSKYNMITKSWGDNIVDSIVDDTYLHHTKKFSEIDSSLYTFGGYGHHTYRSSVNRYSLKNKQWESIKVDSTIFNPRYLLGSSLSKNKDTIFLIGGYGSDSGKQSVNPKSYYDVIAFSIKNKNMSKVGNFIDSDEDLCFANSFVLEKNGSDFYALVFPKYKFNNELQLVKGNIKKKGLVPHGNEIPFLFHDVFSYSDLFLSTKLNKLFAVTVFENKDLKQSKVSIYSIAFPPNVSLSQKFEPIKKVEEKAETNHSYIYWFIGILLVGGLSIYFLKLRNKKKKLEILELDTDSKTENTDTSQTDIETKSNLVEQTDIEATSNSKSDHKMEIPNKNKISLFGNIQIYNNEGIDILNKFSPLLKEMFLLIILNSFKFEKGIASKKIDEILWFDKSEQKAKNNRFVNLNKLKALISQINGCEINYKSGFCRIDIDDSIAFFDYKFIKEHIDNKNVNQFDKYDLQNMLEVVSRGNLLVNYEYEWIDNFKSQFENELIDFLSSKTEELDSKQDSTLLIKCCDTILKFDSLNEESILLKCKVYHDIGKHSMLKKVYTKFTEEYKNLYGEDYDVSFDEFVKELN